MSTSSARYDEAIVEEDEGEIPIYFENAAHKMTGIDATTTADDLIYAILWYKNGFVDEVELHAYDVYASVLAGGIRQCLPSHCPVLDFYQTLLRDYPGAVRMDISSAVLSRPYRRRSLRDRSMSCPDTRSSPPPASGHEAAVGPWRRAISEVDHLSEIASRQDQVLRDLDVRLRVLNREVENLAHIHSQSSTSAVANGDDDDDAETTVNPDKLVALNKRIEFETSRIHCLTNALHRELLCCPSSKKASLPTPLSYYCPSQSAAILSSDTVDTPTLHYTRTMSELCVGPSQLDPGGEEEVYQLRGDLFVTLSEMRNICITTAASVHEDEEMDDEVGHTPGQNDRDSDTGIGSLNSEEGVTYYTETLV